MKQFPSFLLLSLLSTNTLAIGINGFNNLQNNSEEFVRTTCGGFVNNGATTADEMELFTICATMVQSVNDLPGNGGGDTRSRQLDTETLASGFQNIVPEETLAPIGISANTSSINLSAINTRLAKIRAGGAGDNDLFSSSSLGFYINGMGGFGETDKTSEQDAANFDSIGVISGFDYRITDNLILGIAGSYSSFNLDFDKNTNVSGGGIDSDDYNVIAYSTYNIGNGYVEGVFSYGWSDFDINRSIFIASNSAVAAASRTAKANPDGEQFSISLASGYDFHTGGLSYGPYAKIAYFESTIDSYKESGAGGLNLRVSEHKSDSLETVLGAQMSYAMSYSFGVLVPHLKGEWHHEYKNSQRSFDVRYINDPRNNTYRSITGNPDRNFFNVSAGMSANLKHGVQAFFDYETILGLNNLDAHKFSLGLRMEF